MEALSAKRDGGDDDDMIEKEKSTNIWIIYG
jgi:hypothetical protein